MQDEDLAKLLNNTWNELDTENPVDWDYLPPKTKEQMAIVARKIYQAGFEAGADSVGPYA